jgi:cytochrome c551/c552
LQNIKVLPKEWSRPQVQQLMQTFVESLGVAAPAGEGCGHCHTVDTTAPPPQPGRGPAFNFASDDKPVKDVARKMIQMTMALNADTLKGVGDEAVKEKVSCFTCHQGAKKPANAPAAGWARGNFTLTMPGPTLPARGARPGGPAPGAPAPAPAPQ